MVTLYTSINSSSIREQTILLRIINEIAIVNSMQMLFHFAIYADLHLNNSSLILHQLNFNGDCIFIS